MLILCPECETEISDKAIDCPHCGYPMQKPKISRKKRGIKHPKLPNGFGQISEIKTGNLRKPFRVMVTVGKTDTGKPICKLLQPDGFFKTYNEAYTALVEYNKNPYELDSCITVKELYDRWSEEHFKTISKSHAATIRCTWKYCNSLYNMKVRELKTFHIKECIKNAKAIIKGEEKAATACYKKYIKSLFSQILTYGMEYGLVDNNCAEAVNISEITKEISKNKTEHIMYSDEEIQKMWDNLYKIPYIDVLLIQCYGGWRPQELGLIEIKNVDLENGIIIGGIKTEAGKNRIVPIHPLVYDLVKKRYEEALSLGSEYLINATEKQNHKEQLMLTYDSYKYHYGKIKKELSLNPDHRAHDGRKHFISKAKQYDLDEYAIKYIVGHQIKDVTEKVYTERQITWLKSEMEKIK